MASIATALGVLGASVRAEIITVPDDQPTIQSAIAVAIAGDEIAVSPGTYVESIDLLGKAVTVRSTAGAAATTIEGAGAGPVVLAERGEGPDTVLEGFTISGAKTSGLGGGMRIAGASPTVRSCAFVGNVARRGGGMYVTDGAEPRVQGCLFLGNVVNERGGGMAVQGESAPVIISSRFIANSAGERGGGLYAQTGSALVVNSLLLRNFGTERGAGIAAMSFSDVQVINSTIRKNLSTRTGGGIYAQDSTVTVRNSICWDDLPNEISVAGKSGHVDVAYSDVEGGFAGTGNINANPRFLAANLDDLRLSPGSPCIDVGDNDALPPDTFDLDGDGDVLEPIPVDQLENPRLTDDPETDDAGDGSTPVVDMGALEYAGIFFVSPEEFEADGVGITEAAGDLDGDGDEDIAIVIPDVDPLVNGRVQVFLNDGTDEFGGWLGLTALDPITVGREPSGVAIGLLNEDAFADLAVTNAGDGTVTILVNLGDGTFDVVDTIPVGNEPRGVAAADFTGDGRTDLATANAADGEIALLVNQLAGPTAGLGSMFVVEETASVGNQPTSIDPTDLDNDKDIDLVASIKGDNSTRNLLNTTGDPPALGGGGLFRVAPAVLVGIEPVDVATADFDLDGFVDFATADRGAGTVSVGLSNGGAFDTLLTLPVGALPVSVDAADLDGDMDPDLAVVADDDELGRVVQVLVNRIDEGEGLVFGGEFSFPVDDVPGSAAAPNFVVDADLNEDGVSDLITVNDDTGTETGGSVTVLISAFECLADLNADGETGWPDLTSLLVKWGPCDPAPSPCPWDLDGDGVIGLGDLTQILMAWGSCVGQ